MKRASSVKGVAKKGGYQPSNQMSFISSKSKKILEKMRQREQGHDISYERPTQSSAIRRNQTEALLKNNVTDSSDLIINEKNYKPIRTRPLESGIKSNSSQS